LKSVKTKTIKIEAFNEEEVKKKAEAILPNGSSVSKIKIAEKGKSGFIGIGKKPNIYQISYCLPETIKPTESSDLATSLVHGLLMPLSGSWIRIADNESNILGAISCFIELKLTLGAKFSGALVFQDADELTSFRNSQMMQRLVNLGGIKPQDLNKENPKRAFKSLLENNTLFLLTLPYLNDLSFHAYNLSRENDKIGRLSMWKPMPIICIVRDPSKVSWGRNKPRNKKPCCASVRSLFGLEGLISTGKELIFDEVIEALKTHARLHID
jgi:hypothetical protein